MKTTEMIITLQCDKCNNNFTITEDKRRRRIKAGTPNYCSKCMKEHTTSIKKNYFNNLSEEEKAKFINKRNWYSRASDEEKALHAKKSKDAFAARSVEEQDIINKKNSDGLKRHWKTVSDEDKKKRLTPMRNGNSEYWNSLSIEERSEKAKQWMYNMSRDELDKHLKMLSDRMSEYNASLSIDEKRRRAKNMERWHDNLSEEQKKEFYRQTHQWYHDLSEEEKINYANNRSLWYDNLSDDEKQIISNNHKEYWKNLPEKEKERFIEKQRQHWENMPNDERISISLRHKEIWNNLPDDVKKQQSERMKSWWSSLSEDEYNEYVSKFDWYSKLSEKEKQDYSESRRLVWANLSDDEKRERVSKSLSNNSCNTSLNSKFEKMFHDSYLRNDYYLMTECSSLNITIHSWDYGIYSKKDNQLIMLVDLDGEYFHADKCDYDGLHSKEEYDEQRSLSIPDGVMYYIFQEKIFSKCFDEMIKMVIHDYDQFISNIFKQCRSMPFPYPHYTDHELIKSWNQLIKMDCNDKYHKDISLNTRLGDRIIQHFHRSIYHAHRINDISPYDAWYNDELLKKCIKNRVIYQTYLNPNKILQGFNVSRIAMKVSVFSAGRAKMLISKYLNDCNEIFDPFSGFSGRMLGTVSLGKRYIGQDISPIHVRESNEIIKFLDIDAKVNEYNILDSSGEYECLFTCPPYEDIEQWQDVKPDTRSCDDWIDECLKRFKCRKYLFVVDYTERYIDNVVDEIHNRSHLNSNSEYVIQIIR